MDKQLWLPPSVTADTKPAFRCRICGDTFRAHEQHAFARHVDKCFAANEGEVRMMSLRERAPAICGDDGVDVEFQRWHKDRGFRHAT